MCQPEIGPRGRKSAYFYVVMALIAPALPGTDALYLCSCTYVGACRAARPISHSGAHTAWARIDFGTFEAQWIRARCFASPRNDVRTILRSRRLVLLRHKPLMVRTANGSARSAAR
jgi:hypothetical protein